VKGDLGRFPRNKQKSRNTRRMKVNQVKEKEKIF
jgi:hypothetical protein